MRIVYIAHYQFVCCIWMTECVKWTYIMPMRTHTYTAPMKTCVQLISPSFTSERADYIPTRIIVLLRYLYYIYTFFSISVLLILLLSLSLSLWRPFFCLRWYQEPRCCSRPKLDGRRRIRSSLAAATLHADAASSIRQRQPTVSRWQTAVIFSSISLFSFHSTPSA